MLGSNVVLKEVAFRSLEHLEAPAPFWLRRKLLSGQIEKKESA